MIGDDACTAFVEILKKLMDIAGDIAKEQKSKAFDKKLTKTPKIKVGRLSKREFNKLQSAGKEFKFMTVSAKDMEKVEETVGKMGGSYFDAHLGENNTHVIAVPAGQLDLLNTALKSVLAEGVKNSTVKIKDGNDLTEAEDIRLVRDVMNRYDIPVASFKTDENKYMNVVPDEFDGQYSKALKEAMSVKKEIKNTDIVCYECTAPLDNLDYFAEIISEDEAQALAGENLDIEFVKREDDKTAILYKPECAEKVKRARDEYAESLKDSEEYLIDIMGNVITLDVEKLMIHELCSDGSVFMKVPNTNGQDHIRLDRSEIEVINNGKTVKTELDLEKTYPVYDSEGGIKREDSGMELAKFFNTKNPRANDKTEVIRCGTKGDELRRIDLYCKSKNKLISMKLDSAENIRIYLAEQNFSKKAAEKLLADIDKALTDKQKEIFNFTAVKPDIVYADVPNIGDYLTQTQLSREVLTAADCVGELPKESGPVCCVHDKMKNIFAVIPAAPVNEIMSRLADMGYSENALRELANRAADRCREKGFVLSEEKSVDISYLKRFEGNNAELASMGYYKCGSAAVIIRDDSESYRYMQIEKNTPVPDIEKALREEFELADDISVAAAIRRMQREGIIPEPKVKESREAEVSKITSNIIEVKCRESGQSAMLNMKGFSAERLMDIGLSEKAAHDMRKSFDKSFEEEKQPFKQTLSFLKSFAERKAMERSDTENVKDIFEFDKGDER
ncbi:MAG: hypothetical protein NC120_06645 [Ruminococcus sp.]|nr:hypothetical protein [Ruminococcus sp.]